MMTEQNAELRYLHDPVFHALVHQAMQAVKAEQFTFDEIRAAVALAERILRERAAREGR